MKNLTLIKKILIWAAGFDIKTAQHCSESEISRMVTYGTLVFIPAFVALFSYSYAFNYAFDNIKAAIAGGIAAAIVLFIIERGIMATGRPGHFTLGMAGRLAFALCIGFMIAEPVILRVFEDSIDEEQYAELTNRQKEGVVSFDTQIADYRNELKGDEKHLLDLRKDYTQEMDGTGGSKQINQGPIYQKKLDDYKSFEAKYNQKVATTNTAIASIETRKNSTKTEVKDHQANRLLGRMQTLHRIAEKDSIVFASVWLLRLAFILIELIPLFLKMSPTGSRNSYYAIADKSDEESEQVFSMSSAERLKIKQQEDKLIYTEAYANLCHSEIKVLIDNKEKDTTYLMSKALMMSEKKTDLIGKVVKKIKDKQLLDEVIASIQSSHNGYMTVLNELIGKSNSNYPPSKI
jgi:hypothetical protein